MTALLAGAHAPAALGLEAASEIDAAAHGEGYVWGGSGQPTAETFSLPKGVATGLSAAAHRGPLLVRDFPIAPGERADVLFERLDVYAPGARIRIVDDEGSREQPRSARVHLLGSVAAAPRVRVGLSMDADGGELSGLVKTPSGVYGLWQLASDDPMFARYEVGRSLEDRLGLEIETACGAADRFELGLPIDSLGGTMPQLGGSTPTHVATIAFDTDGELLADYGNDTAAATDAIADLVAALNVIYERDLGLRLLQGETLLRTNPAGDPYESSSTSAQLDEVGAWWEANQSAVERVWVALLSGKGSSQGGGCSGAGIAWVDQYCDPVVSGGPWDGGSYSATQVLRCLPLAGGSNTRLIGHEVGHNAGSGHTHCYSPEIDQCYNAHSGCFSGSPSCPDHSSVIPGITPGKGTIMSYCHFGGAAGAGCGSSEAYFHPVVIARIQQSINAATPLCVALTGGDLAVVVTDSEDPVGRGTGLSYTVTVTNLGPAAATGVEVDGALPAGTTLISTSGCAEDPAGVPTCTLGQIASGASKAFATTVLVGPSAPALLQNSVTVSAATNDPVPSNDAASETTTVASWPCHPASLDLNAADNATPGPFVSEGSITAGDGFEVGVGESIVFRTAAEIRLTDGFTAAGDFSAMHDPFIDCE